MASVYHWVGVVTFWAVTAFVSWLIAYRFFWRLGVWIYSAFKIYRIFRERLVFKDNGLLLNTLHGLRFAWRQYWNDDYGDWYITLGNDRLYYYGARLVKGPPLHEDDE